MKRNVLMNWVSVLLLLAVAGQAWAATPPELVNFEGVLRDAMGNPENGARDMTFYFYDADGGGVCPAAGGTLLLTDEHLNAGTGDVTVTDGLFNVQLGSGNLVAGSEASLAEVFRDNATVYVEVEINTEVLCPRIHVTASGYALNASNLDGKAAGEFVDTSATAQVKAGSLNVNTMTLSGNLLSMASGGQLLGTSAYNWLYNNEATDDLYLWAGTTDTHGGLDINGQGDFFMYSGNGLFRFRNGGLGGTETALLDGLGNFQIDGDLTVTGTNVFGASGSFLELGDFRNIIQNSSDTDDLFLQAGNDITDGSLILLGDGATDMWGGNGDFRFLSGDASALTVALETPTSYLLLNDAATTVAGPFIRGTTGQVWILAGADDTDTLFLYGGNSANDGEVTIRGGSTVDLRAGNGDFELYSGDGTFLTTAWNTSTAYLLLNNTATTTVGPLLRGDTTSAYLLAGDADTDDLFLYAGNSLDDGRIFIGGDSLMELRAGNGNFSFINGATGVETADVSSSGALQLDSYWETDLDMDLLDETVATVSGSPATFSFAGSSLELSLGDNSFDDVLVPGSLFVTGTKSFIQNHPEREDLSIAYVALEGAEAGTYTRGSGRLVGGEATVALDETFAWTTNPEIGLTAHVTARGQAALYVDSVSTSELVVRSVDGSDVAFDYVVYGLRIGHEEFPVVRQRTRVAPLPSSTILDKKYPRRAELGAYTAGARFRRIEEEVSPVGPAQRSAADGAAQALRLAIGLDDGVEPAHVHEAEEPVVVEDEAWVGEAVSDPGGVAVVPETRPGAPDASERPSPAVVSGSLPMDEEGNVYARSFRPSATDLASLAPVAEAVEAGDVLVIDAERPGTMSLAREAGDSAVVGVVAAEPGVVLGAQPPGKTAAGGQAAEEVPVAVSGVVVAKVDAGYGAIRPGDLLVTSPTAGHAMRSDDPRPGTILGKALEALEVGTGTIRVLVTLR